MIQKFEVPGGMNEIFTSIEVLASGHETLKHVDKVYISLKTETVHPEYEFGKLVKDRQFVSESISLSGEMAQALMVVLQKILL